MTDSERQLALINEALSAQNAGKVEAAFRQLEDLYHDDNDISQTDYYKIIAQGEIILDARNEMMNGPFLITGPSLILEPLYRLAADEALAFIDPYSEDAAINKLEFAIRDISALIAEDPPGPLYEEFLFRRREVQDAYDALLECHSYYCGAQFLLDDLLTKLEEAMRAAGPNVPGTQIFTVEVTQRAYKALNGGLSNRGHWYDFFYCRDFTVQASRMVNGKSLSFEIISDSEFECERPRFANVRRELLRSDAQRAWPATRQYISAGLNRYAISNDAAYVANDIVNLGREALYGLERQTPGLITPTLRARIAANDTAYILRQLRQRRDADLVALYVVDMENRRNTTEELIASADARLATARSEAESAGRLQRVSSLLTRAGQMIETGVRIQTWLEEEGFFVDPTPIASANPDDLNDVAIDDPKWTYEDQQTTALHFASNREEAIMHMETLVERLNAADVSGTPDRLDFEALSYVQMATGFERSDVIETMNAASNTNSNAANLIWSKVPEILRDVLDTFQPSPLGDGLLYGREHESHLLSQILAALGKREAARSTF